MKRQKVKMSRRELNRGVRRLFEIEAEKRAAGIDPYDELVEERSNGDPFRRELLECMFDDMRAGLNALGEPMDEPCKWNPLWKIRVLSRHRAMRGVWLI